MQAGRAGAQRWRRPGWLTRGVAVAAAVAAVVGLLGGLLGGWLSGSWGRPSGACDAIGVARDVLPGVVTIAAQGPAGSGTGSGAITSADGVVVTNDHVISVAAQSGRIEVRLSDGTTKPSTLVGHDPKTDLAVLKVDATNLPVVAFGDATALQVGQPVIALGAPLGLSNTVTTGIVSALGRDVTAPTGDGGTTVLLGSIQTDASINPGNSGGPLVDCAGRLIGINTAISTVPNASGAAGGGSVGIGFAVPADTVSTISAQLLARGRVSHPWLGMSTASVPEAAAKYFNTPTGLFVQAVASPGPAAAAGLQVGDILTQLNGQPATPASVAHLLETAAVGDKVTVDYVRAGAAGTAQLTLAEQP